MIIKEVDSLKKLVDAFSKYGRMPEIRKTPTSFPALIHEVVNLYKGYKKIEIHILSPDNPPLADLDAEQFKRVIINIFDNAIQAMMHNGKIDVTLSFDTASNSVQIEIADNGPGIKHEDREKLFHPYFSTKKDGTGLGLAIAHRIIKEHKGKIRVRDNIPTGTVFTIRIPIKETS
jgi:two-component system nitrogen regulation sensor histidine kinase NtrY